MGCCGSSDAAGERNSQNKNIKSINEPITTVQTQQQPNLPAKVQVEPKSQNQQQPSPQEPPKVAMTKPDDHVPVVLVGPVNSTIKQQIVVAPLKQPIPQDEDEEDEEEEEEEEEEQEEQKTKHTEPNPLIAQYIDKFYEHCKNEREKKQKERDQEDVDNRDLILIDSALISLKEEGFKPALDLLSNVLNQLHRSRYVEEETVPEKEEEAIKRFIGSLRFSLDYPFMNTSSSLRLCLAKLVPLTSSSTSFATAGGKAKPVSKGASPLLNNNNNNSNNKKPNQKNSSVTIRFSIQEQILADRALKERTHLATQERLGHVRTFERRGSGIFDGMEDFVENNETVQNAIGTAIDFAKELPFVGSFIKPLVVIGKFCYQRAKALEAQSEMAKALLKEMERHVRRLARMDDLAELLFQDERENAQRMMNAAAASASSSKDGSGEIDMSLLLQKDSQSTTFEVAQALEEAQLIIARCFDAASRHDDKTNSWLDKISNFFLAKDDSELFTRLRELLNDKINILVTLVNDKIQIANTYRLKRMENLLETIALNNNNNNTAAAAGANFADTPLIDMISDEEKRVLVKMLRSALANSYRARFRFNSPIYKGATYYLDDFFTDVVCHSSHRESAQTSNFLKHASCNFILLNSSAGNGKSIFLKRLAEMQLVFEEDTSSTNTTSSNSKTNKKKKKRTKSTIKKAAPILVDNNNNNNTSPYPGLVIYLDLDSNEFKNSVGNNIITDINPLLDTILNGLQFEKNNNNNNNSSTSGGVSTAGVGESDNNNKLAYKIRQNMRSLLREIICDQNVPITWLIDGYEKIAAKLQLRQEDTSSVNSIEEFFNTFATPNGRMRSRDRCPELIRVSDTVVLAVRPEFVTEIAPPSFGSSGEAIEGHDFVCYNLPVWTREQSTYLAERLFVAINKERDVVEIERKARQVLESAHHATTLTPRFINLLAQCFMKQELMAKTTTKQHHHHQQQQQQDLIDVIETYLNISFSMNNISGSVPLDDLCAAGEFALDRFQKGEDLRYVYNPSQQWMVDFERAQLVGKSSDSPGTRILFPDSPEFGELVAALYLRKKPEMIGDLKWDSKNASIWMNVAKHIFSHKCPDTVVRQKVIDNFSYKFACSYEEIRADIEEILLETFSSSLPNDVASGLAEHIKQQRNPFGGGGSNLDDGTTIGNTSIASNGNRSRRGFSLFDINSNNNNNNSIASKNQQSNLSGSFVSAVGQPPSNPKLKFAWLHLQKSVAFALRDNHRFSELQDRCHADLLADLLLLIDKQFRGSGKKVLVYLSQDHLATFPNDPRPEIPPYFLWLMSQLSRNATSLPLLRCIEEEYFSDFKTHPMPPGFSPEQASLQHYNPSRAFGINFHEGKSKSGDYNGELPIRLMAKQLAKKLNDRMTQRRDQNNKFGVTSTSNLRNSALVVGASSSSNSALGAASSQHHHHHHQGSSIMASMSALSSNADVTASIWNTCLIAYYEQINEHRDLTDDEQHIAFEFKEFLKKKGAQLKFLEAIRLSRKSRTPVDEAFKEDRADIDCDKFVGGLRLCVNKRSGILCSCLLENAAGMSVPVEDLVQAIELVADQQHLLDSKRIKRIDLSNSELSSVDQIALLARALRKFTLLEELFLSNNNFEIINVCALVEELFALVPPSQFLKLHPLTLKPPVPGSDENDPLEASNYNVFGSAATANGSPGYNNNTTADEEDSPLHQKTGGQFKVNFAHSDASPLTSTEDGSGDYGSYYNTPTSKKHDIPLPNLKFLDISCDPKHRLELGSFLIAATAIFNRNVLAKSFRAAGSNPASPNKGTTTNFPASSTTATQIALKIANLKIGEDAGVLVGETEEAPYYKYLRTIVKEKNGFFTPEMIDQIIGRDFPGTEKKLFLCGKLSPVYINAHPSYYCDAIANVLRRSTEGIATHINLSFTQIGSDTLTRVFTNNRIILMRNLISLELDDCALGTSVDFFKLLIGEPNLHVEVLRLSRNGLGGNQCCNALKNLLIHLRGTLKSLDLSHNEFGTDLVTQLLCAMVQVNSTQQAPLLMTLTKLNKLFIDYNNLHSGKEDQSSHLLLKVCECCPDSIQKLGFKECGVVIAHNETDRGWSTFLEDRVVNKKTLKSLDISGDSNVVTPMFCREWQGIWKKGGLRERTLTLPDASLAQSDMARLLAIEEPRQRNAQLEETLMRKSGAHHDHHQNQQQQGATSNAARNSRLASAGFQILEAETWENWRWYPIRGWSSSLMPTDRPKWSSHDGKQELPKESFNGKYDFVGDWEVVVDPPQNTDGEGWQYARDFPATYHPENFFGVCVRRRKWIRRYRVPTNPTSNASGGGMGTRDETEGFALV